MCVQNENVERLLRRCKNAPADKRAEIELSSNLGRRAMKWNAQLVLWSALVLIAAPGAAFAQGGTAALSGIVVDESKAVLPGVTVTATEVSTGRAYSAMTDQRGEYRMPNVTPGSYKA